MVSTRFVVRLLDAECRLLGWCDHEAQARGDGDLRASSAVVVTVDEAGVPAWVSWHWCDVHAEVRVPMTGPVPALQPGHTIGVADKGDVVVHIGAPTQALPPVTVKATAAILVPVGRLGA